MNASSIIGLGALVIVVAGLSAALYRGEATARVIGSIGTSFSQVIGAATLSGAGTGA